MVPKQVYAYDNKGSVRYTHTHTHTHIHTLIRTVYDNFYIHYDNYYGIPGNVYIYISIYSLIYLRILEIDNRVIKNR